MKTENIINDTLNKIKQDNITKEGGLKFLPVIDKVYYDDSLVLRFYIFLQAMVESPFSVSNKNLLLYVSSAKGYAQIAIETIAHNLCSCSGYTEDNPSSTFSRKMIEIVPMLLPFALSNDWEGTKKLLQTIVDSLNAKNCLIERGQHDAHIAWFSVKLLSNVLEFEIGRKPFYPNKKKFAPYQTILEEWDNEDLVEVDKMSFMLCELHLSSKEYHSRAFSWLFAREYSILLPYEVMIWLKLREYKGLKNPKTFSHPLMQTKLMKKLLRIDTNLPAPQSDLELKLFLEEKVQVMCPDNDVLIPEWLEGKNEPTPNNEDILPDDFMK